MRHSDDLGTTVNTVDKRTLKAAHEIREVVPGLAHQSRRWTRRTICPMCSGPKDRTAFRCLSCHRKAKVAHAAGNPPPVSHPEGLYGRGRQWGRVGVHVEQPPLSRWVKVADGSWQKVDG